MFRVVCAVAGLAFVPAAPAADPAPARVFALDRGRIFWVAVTPDSKRLLVACNGDKGGAELRLWDLATGALVAGPVAAEFGADAAGAVSPDGTRAVSGDARGRWQAWELPGLKPLAAGKAGNGRVYRVAYAPGGKAVALLNADYRRKLTDPIKSTRVTFRASVVTPDGPEKTTDFAAAWPRWLGPGETPGGPWAGEPADWPVAAGPAFDAAGRPVPPRGDAVRALVSPGDEKYGAPVYLAVSPDRKHAATVASGGRLVVWDYPARKPLGEPLKVNGRDAFEVEFGPDGTRLAVVGRGPDSEGSRTLTVLDVASRTAVFGPVPCGGGQPVFTPDGSAVVLPVMLTGTSKIEVWPVPARK